MYEKKIQPEIYKLIKQRSDPPVPLSQQTFYKNQKIRKSYDYATNFRSKESDESPLK